MASPPTPAPPSPVNTPLSPTFSSVTTIIPLGILLVVIAIRSFVTESLWLDETISAWVTNGSLSEAINRSMTYQGQSPFYFTVLWLWRQLFGASELSLRAPSLILLGMAGILLWRIAARLLSREAAWIAVFLLFTFDEILTAVNARPYALALACSLASILCLLRWSETQRVLDGILYLATTLATVYAHYLFALVGIVHLTYLVTTRSALLRDSRRQLVGISLAGILLSIPACMQLLSLHNRRESLYFAVRPSLSSLLSDLLPFATTLSLVCGLIIARIHFSNLKCSTTRRTTASLLPTLLVWHIAPPLIFFILAWFSSGSLALGRLYLWHLAAYGILIAWLLTSLTPTKAARLAFSVVALLAIFRECGHRWQTEDWRGATHYINTQVPLDDAVLMYSGLVELNQSEWLLDQSRWPYLMAPLATYPLTHTVTPLPANLLDPGKQHVLNTIIPLIETHNGLTLLALQQNSPGGSALTLTTSLLQSRGFREIQRENFGQVAVLRFARGETSLGDRPHSR